MSKSQGDMLSSESATLVSGYSDLVLQCFSQLRGREEECLSLVDLVDQLRRKWKEASEHCVLAEERYHRIEQEKDKLKEEYDMLREMYHDSKAKVGSLISAKEDLQQQLKEYEQRVRSIRTLIEQELKDTVAFSQLTDLCKVKDKHLQQHGRATRSQDNVLDIDFDKTNEEEEIDEVQLRYNRTYQRRSKSVEREMRTQSQPAKNVLPPGVTKRSRSRHIPENITEEDENTQSEDHVPTPPKRSRDMFTRDEHITTVTTITMDARGRAPTRASVEVHRGKKRSVSESRAFEPQSPFTPGSCRIGTSTTDLRSPITSMGSSWTKGYPVLEVPHNLEQVSNALLKSCAVCNRTVTMRSAYKCRDCGIYLHPHNCMNKAPLPCLPFASEKSKKQTPQKGKRAPRLADLCPTAPPLVPAVPIRLIYEIEKRLQTEGLYRVPGTDRVQRLYTDMMSGTVIPQLQNELTEVLTSTLKKFLSNLKEPLIPTTSYKEFIQAARERNPNRLIQVVSELPYPNRDTLALLCIHLQKVAKCANENKMPVETLATCIGVTVLVGGRKDQNTLEQNSSAQGYSEVEKQKAVMEQLLLLPEDYWEKYLNSRTLIVGSQIRASRSPRVNTPRRADQSILGPVSETPPTGFTATPTRSAKERRRRGLGPDLFNTPERWS